MANVQKLVQLLEYKSLGENRDLNSLWIMSIDNDMYRCRNALEIEMLEYEIPGKILICK